MTDKCQSKNGVSKKTHKNGVSKKLIMNPGGVLLYLENRILATQIFSNENREKTSKVRKEGGTVTLGGEAGERKATKRHS